MSLGPTLQLYSLSITIIQRERNVFDVTGAADVLVRDATVHLRRRQLYNLGSGSRFLKRVL